MSTICMKIDPGMHIGLHLILFGKTGVTGKVESGGGFLTLGRRWSRSRPDGDGGAARRRGPCSGSDVRLRPSLGTSRCTGPRVRLPQLRLLASPPWRSAEGEARLQVEAFPSALPPPSSFLTEQIEERGQKTPMGLVTRAARVLTLLPPLKCGGARGDAKSLGCPGLTARAGEVAPASAAQVMPLRRAAWG
jgi:hypothetical protein